MTRSLFEPVRTLPNGLGRAGVLRTDRGPIYTPAFIPVGTQASIKALLPEQIRQAGAQAVLANAYHLYLQPGVEVVELAGGLGAFMGWAGPTFTDSGGFQIMSLGLGGAKVKMSAEAGLNSPRRKRLTNIDEEGVWFTSHRDGSRRRFSPEIAMRIQHRLGADIIFAFDELTRLEDPKSYQIQALERTARWAERCVIEHEKLSSVSRVNPALFGVVQGANYPELRKRACRQLEALGFVGFGLGGAIEKPILADIIRWCSQELPPKKPRHLLGISEPDDLMAAIEMGADTFDCVSPTRVARNGAFYTPEGRKNLKNRRYRTDFAPLVEGCACYACARFSRAYLHHLVRAREILPAILLSLHNEQFTINLVAGARKAILNRDFPAYSAEVLGRYYRTNSR